MLSSYPLGSKTISHFTNNLHHLVELGALLVGVVAVPPRTVLSELALFVDVQALVSVSAVGKVSALLTGVEVRTVPFFPAEREIQAFLFIRGLETLLYSFFLDFWLRCPHSVLRAFLLNLLRGSSKLQFALLLLILADKWLFRLLLLGRTGNISLLLHRAASFEVLFSFRRLVAYLRSKIHILGSLSQSSCQVHCLLDLGNNENGLDVFEGGFDILVNVDVVFELSAGFVESCDVLAKIAVDINSDGSEGVDELLRALHFVACE